MTTIDLITIKCFHHEIYLPYLLRRLHYLQVVAERNHNSVSTPAGILGIVKGFQNDGHRSSLARPEFESRVFFCSSDGSVA